MKKAAKSFILAYTLLFLLCTYTVAEESQSTLGISAYIVDEELAGIMENTSLQQALCILDSDNMQVNECIKVYNGSYVLKDLSDASSVFAISPSAEGIVEYYSSADFVYPSRTIIKYSKDSSDTWTAKQILEPSIDILFSYSDQLEFYIGMYGDDVAYKLMNVNPFDYDNFTIKKETRNKDIQCFSDEYWSFDIFYGWKWPSEVVSVSPEGKVAVIYYSEWSWNTSINFYDTNNDAFVEVVVDTNLIGPMCWLNEKEILIWRNERDKPYCELMVLNVETKTFEPYCSENGNGIKADKNPVETQNTTLSEIPKMSMAINQDHTEIAFWTGDVYGRLPTKLNHVDLITGKWTTAVFDNDSEWTDKFLADTHVYANGEHEIFLPYSNYCPTIFFLN